MIKEEKRGILLFGVLEFGLSFLALQMVWKFGFVQRKENYGKGSSHGDSMKL